MFHPSSSGPLNLRGSILLAGSLFPCLREVSVFSEGRLLRGTRAAWCSDRGRFVSPGAAPLAVLDHAAGAEPGISVNYKEINRGKEKVRREGRTHVGPEVTPCFSLLRFSSRK